VFLLSVTASWWGGQERSPSEWLRAADDAETRIPVASGVAVVR
jgi:hypothetical protein